MKPRRILLPAAISDEAPMSDGRILDFGGESMGTTWSARLVQRTDAPDLPALKMALQQGLQAQLDAVVAEMSHWQAGSDLGRFNRAGACTWHTLPDAFYTVLDYAMGIARASGGA